MEVDFVTKPTFVLFLPHSILICRRRSLRITSRSVGYGFSLFHKSMAHHHLVMILVTSLNKILRKTFK